MNAYPDLEEKVKARGVRVAERLEILRILQELDGPEQLAARVEEHERAMETAARKAREGVR